MAGMPEPGGQPPFPSFEGIVKLGDKERFDKEQIGVQEPFPATKATATNMPVCFIRQGCHNG